MTSDREGSLQPLDEDKVSDEIFKYMQDAIDPTYVSGLAKAICSTFGASRKADKMDCEECMKSWQTKVNNAGESAFEEGRLAGYKEGFEDNIPC